MLLSELVPEEPELPLVPELPDVPLEPDVPEPPADCTNVKEVLPKIIGLLVVITKFLPE